ncbi:hypothetical protein [Lactobacillus gigeriorum]|uniref:Uncharacterized protein n=1 Tax=Lactobacillus gigeriorum DSM 23908 = CRBIP 24.85 TaxID=1423751 RepID=I7K1G8_9LACO|nr:hypothetical protein [Lactobacillus gigeriorum]KRN09453.1 hypothetical protein FC38_GL001418 [Lactobacillus gigeriorum DSM 23908 = CRBIP 24.85]CCI87435.1 Protein of unknown function [Lactobacillus gigeriorum DSM 23908 = CRBIP 24.85]
MGIVNLASEGVSEATLVSRIKEQRKATKKMYKMRYLPNCVAFKDTEYGIPVAKVLVEAPFDKDKYEKRSCALSYALSSRSIQDLKLDPTLTSAKFELASPIHVPKLTQDMLLFSSVKEHPKDDTIQDDLFEFPVFEGQPKSMEEFFSRLETIGKAWHKAYDTIDSDTDRVIKRTKMDARTTLDLLEHYVSFYHLYSSLEEKKNISTSPVWFLDYNQKIYCTDGAIIGQMLQTINYDITRRSSHSLLHWKILKQNCFRDFYFLMVVIFYLVLSDFIYQR